MVLKRRLIIRAAYTGAMLLLTSVAAIADTPPERTMLAQPPRALTDFELTSHEGKPLRLSQLRGAPVLLFFGFAHCPTVCPAALQQLRELDQKHKADLGPTRIVVISVDGERDTPQVLAGWVKPLSKSFTGLTGSPATVKGIAAQFTAAFYKTPGKEAGEYLVEHNSQIYLIDARRQAACDLLQCAGGHDGGGDEVDRGRGQAPQPGTDDQRPRRKRDPIVAIRAQQIPTLVGHEGAGRSFADYLFELG